jgi:hypothetical protein
MIDKIFCYPLRRHYADRLDGVPIPLLRRLGVRCHLAICPGCIRYNRALEATRAGLAGLRDPDPGDGGGGSDSGPR